MDKNELMKKFRENIAYLERNIPPEDIYVFTEQTFMAALFFLKRWSDWVDVDTEMNECEVTKKWVMNIIGLQMLREKNQDVDLDLNLPKLDEE